MTGLDPALAVSMLLAYVGFVQWDSNSFFVVCLLKNLPGSLVLLLVNFVLCTGNEKFDNVTCLISVVLSHEYFYRWLSLPNTRVSKPLHHPSS